MSEIKWSTNLIPFGPCGDKFCSGYRQTRTTEERIKAASKIKGLRAVELHYPNMVNEQNLVAVKKSLSEAGLVCSIVTPSLSDEAKWMGGALTNSNTKLRKEAIERVKRTIDISVELGAHRINLWPGQDGYDYPLQTDYLRSWNMMIRAIKECVIYNPSVQKDPEFDSFNDYGIVRPGSNLLSCRRIVFHPEEDAYISGCPSEMREIEDYRVKLSGGEEGGQINQPQ